MSDPRGGSEGSHPTNEAGDPEGGKTRGEAGDTTEQEKKPRRAQLNDAWFRFTTRLRAIGYWLREKAGIAWRWLKQAAEALGYWWSRRSRGFKTRIVAVAGVVVLYLILKFLPVPGVPCEVSAAKECAPSNDTIAYVPRNADLYAHLTINSDSHQWDLAQDLHDELPNFTALLQSDTSALAIPSARPVDLSREVLPWAKDDLALVGVPGPQKTTPEAYIAGVGDEAKANQFLASLSPGGRSKKAPIGDGTITVYAGGLATGRDGGQALFGNVLAVRAALDAKAGLAPKLEGSPQDAARSALPDVRLAELYLSQAGVQRFLAGRPGTATQLDTFVDYGATTGLAVSARAHDDGVEVNMISDLNPSLERKSPTVFADLPQFEPGLADEAGSNALGYIGVGDLGPGLSKALATAGASAQGLAGSLRALGKSLQQQAGVNPFQDLLPASGRPGGAGRAAHGRRALRQPDRGRRGREEGRGRAGRAAAADPALGRHRCAPGAELHLEGRRRGHGPLRPALAKREPLLRPLRRQAGRLHAAGGDRPGAIRRRQPGGHGRLPGSDRPAPGPDVGASLPQPR